MKLIGAMDQIYSLRENFSIIGLTGRSGAGCSEIAKRLSDRNFIRRIARSYIFDSPQSSVDDLKYEICLKYMNYGDNWKSYHVIKYSSVLVYHLLFEACKSSETKDKAISEFTSIIFNSYKGHKDRFGKTDASNTDILKYITELINKTYHIFENYGCSRLNDCLIHKDTREEYYYNHFFGSIDIFADDFINALKVLDFTKTKNMLRDVACNLRGHGTVRFIAAKGNINSSYTIAETINRLIKAYRKNNGKCARIVIDSLKNSLELTFFKEKYSAFYNVATNKCSQEREAYKARKLKEVLGDEYTVHLENNKKIDQKEYKGGNLAKGYFNAPDIENCIQKSDYHIYWSDSYKDYEHRMSGEKDGTAVDLDRQLVKLIALILQPGIITPSHQERTMQIAFNAKVNSGCISRQVGAVITDEAHSVKAIGWNDVARYQVPCNLRSFTQLVGSKVNQNHFSDFEKGEDKSLDGTYSDGKTFLDKMKENLPEDLDTKLRGRSCSFCFKSCHNAFEGEKNQVHTRSLHAEENAMLQITKYGGQGVKGGFLYTTASPCELCSKKAFQLGIRTIYYIDPYPGIATTHILKSAIDDEQNPSLLMFRGAVGRGFHKLYESFISYKDEVNIRADLHPKMDKALLVEKLGVSAESKKAIMKIINDEKSVNEK